MSKTIENNVLRNHLAAGTEVKGDIITEGDIRIDGKITGTITSKGKLVVGNTGFIDGEVTCLTCNISGTIQGKVKVDEILKMQSTGKINGEISYGKLSIELGAEITGDLYILGKDKKIAPIEKKEKKF